MKLKASDFKISVNFLWSKQNIKIQDRDLKKRKGYRLEKFTIWVIEAENNSFGFFKNKLAFKHFTIESVRRKTNRSILKNFYFKGSVK